MQFLYPLGLLVLLGIPVLILIYIIKSKYAEQTVSSTYIWTLSEKFLKRRNPLSRLTGIISLILQILTVAVAALVVAHPVFIIPGGAQEYCFILDSSGSMNMQREDGTTRFDYGKELISDMISSSAEGSVFTLITVGDHTSTVFEQVADKSAAERLLLAATVGDGEISFADAKAAAQECFNRNPASKTYLVTDVAFDSTENVSVLSVGGSAENYSLDSVQYTDIGKQVRLSGRVLSHGSGAILKIRAYADGSERQLGEVDVYVQGGGVGSDFSMLLDLPEFNAISVVIDAPDALAADNSVVLYDVDSSNSYNALLVTSSPLDEDGVSKSYVSTLLGVFGQVKLDVVSPDDYSAGGYRLYIFEGYVPDEMPRDGAVWFFNPNGSVEGSGFNYKGKSELEVGTRLEMSKSTSALVRRLTSGVIGTSIYLKEYALCGIYDNSFTRLFSIGQDPVIFMGSNSYGNREVVFAFDLERTDLALSTDFVVLVNNLLGYSFPAVLERTDFICGESVEINVLANCESIRIDSPGGNIEFIDPSSAMVEYKLTECGTYTVTLTVEDTPSTYYVFSQIPASERAPLPTADSFTLIGEAGQGGTDGVYDNITVFFTVLALLFTADWMVYLYEKYQLR